jgi:hypothetical protein
MLQLKVVLADIRPPIWRRVLVPASYSLAKLHQVIQAAFGWEDCHLHRFRIHGEDYGPPDLDADEAFRSERVTLGKLGLQAKTKFSYEYDFGDSWEHGITVEAVLTADPSSAPVCLAGKRACPPEDCGGPWGYQDLLATIADPGHPEHESMKEWLGNDGWDAEAFHLDQVNDLLSQAFAPRKQR